MIGIIVQARMGSTRLPGKILMPFGNYTVLEYLLARLSLCKASDHLVVATTIASQDDAVQSLCERVRVSCFRGAETNVLQRFLDAADYSGISGIVRICSDNPFIDPSYVDALVDAFRTETPDYCSYSFADGTPAILSSIGFFGECASVQALRSIKDKKASSVCFEHVTQYLYLHPDDYTNRFLPVPEELQERKIRLTIDTLDDYHIAAEVGNFFDFSLQVPAGEIYRYVLQRDDLLQRMDSQIQQNPKEYRCQK